MTESRLSLLALLLAFVVLAGAPALAAQTEAAEASPLFTAPAAPAAGDLLMTPAVETLPAPQPMWGCHQNGGCNTNMDCMSRSYFCATGEVKTCFGSTGNCDGHCGCC